MNSYICICKYSLTAATCDELGWELVGGSSVCGASWVAPGASCSAALTYTAAVALCERNEARICTSTELMAGNISSLFVITRCTSLFLLFFF